MYISRSFLHPKLISRHHFLFLGNYSFWKNRSQYCFHISHLFIIIDHHHPACQNHNSQGAAQASQYANRSPARRNLAFIVLHSLAEIPYNRITGSSFHSSCIFTQNHIILHHLVSLIINAVSTKFIKTVL